MTTMLTKTSTSFSQLWRKLARSKEYRENYVASYVKRSIPMQIRVLMKKGGLSQQKLADQSGLTQGVISRAADLNYGDLTLNTVIKIAGGFDCAFICKFVSFNEFLREMERKPESAIEAIPCFEKENGLMSSPRKPEQK